jgi:hypothetical protein
MRTEKQIAASRANGARSRGRNSARTIAPYSGDYRMLARAVLRTGESRRGFEEFALELGAFLKPESPMDHILIGRMLAAHWRQLRLWYREKEGGDCFGADESRLDRQFYRAFDRYFKLRAFSSRPPSANNSLESTCHDEKPEPKPEPKPTETQAEPGEAQLETPDASGCE